MIALKRITKFKGSWLPCLGINIQSGFLAQVNPGVKQLLDHPKADKGHLPFHHPREIHYLRTQVPVVNKYVTRVTMEVILEDNGQGPCCKDVKSLEWMSSEPKDNMRLSRVAWGPEPLFYVLSSANSKIAGFDEATVKNALTPPDRPLIDNVAVVDALRYTEKDVLKLYSDYLQHIYPSQFMSEASFITYLNKGGFVRTENERKMNTNQLFNAFSYYDRPYLTFQEFLEGMCAMDGEMKHIDSGAEVRSRFIHRFYDINRSDSLDLLEIKIMIRDCLSAAKMDSSEAAANKILQGLKITSNTLSKKQSLDLLQKRAIPGADAILRHQKSILGSNRVNELAYGPIDETHEGVTILSTGKKAQDVKCDECTPIQYVTAQKWGRLNMDENADEVYAIHPGDLGPSNPVKTSLVSNFMDLASGPSAIIRWCQDVSDVHKLFITKRSRTKNYPNDDPFINVKSDTKMRNLVTVLDLAYQYMSQEKPVIRIEPPVICVGATMGSLGEMMRIEKLFWNPGTHFKGSHFAILGNFMGNSRHTLITVFYLLARKAVDPKNFTILRGGLETRDNAEKVLKPALARIFSNPEKANVIFSKLCMCLDILPLAAVVDSQILLTSSGLPEGSYKVEDIAKVPYPLTNPLSNQIAKGILSGTSAGQASMYEKSLNKLGCNFLVKSGEPSPTGVNYYDNGKVICIWSNTEDGKAQKMGFVQIETGKIRIMRA